MNGTLGPVHLLLSYVTLRFVTLRHVTLHFTWLYLITHDMGSSSMLQSDTTMYYADVKAFSRVLPLCLSSLLSPKDKRIAWTPMEKRVSTWITIFLHPCWLGHFGVSIIIRNANLPSQTIGAFLHFALKDFSFLSYVWAEIGLALLATSC